MGNAEKELSRRTFLKALGIGAALPLALHMSRVVAAAPLKAPVRLFIFYVPHGIPVEHFEPLGAGSTFLSSSSILRPLVPFAHKVTVVRGVSMNDGATNHAAIRALLTGFSDGGKVDSLDHAIARALGTKAHVLGVVPYDRGAGFNSDSYLSKQGSWVRPTERPAEAVGELFATLGGGKEDPEAAFRREAFALSEKELDKLSGAVKGLTREASKLSLHLEAVRAAKAGGSGDITLSCDSLPDLPAVRATQGLEPLEHGNFGKILDAHLEAAAAAFVCGTARVVTLQNLWVNSGLNMGFAGGPGVPKGHHDPVSHSWDKEGRSEFAKVQRWFYERLAAKMLPLLAQADPMDPGKTVLDNTLIWVASEVSDGANHNSDVGEVWLDGTPHQTYLPTVLLGGGGGYLKPGVFDVSRAHTDVLATLHDAMGVPVTSIGGQAVRTIAEVRS
jgi:hypothetical protein